MKRQHACNGKYALAFTSEPDDKQLARPGPFCTAFEPARLMSVISIVLPIFVLVAVGYVAALRGLLSETAQRGISEFAFNYAMPALLFRGIANAGVMPDGSARIAIAYFGATALHWLLATAVTRVILRRPMIDAATVAMTSTWGNVVMIGIPLVLATVGEQAAAPMAIIIALHTPFMWIVGIMHQQAAEHREGRSKARILFDLARELATNALLLSIFAGIAWRFTGIELPHVIDSPMALLAQAGVPCAQVALGASLTRFAIKGQVATLGAVLVLKLLALPVLVYVMAVQVFHLPRTAAAVALVLSSMPAGANAFLFAERTGRVVNSTSGAIALGTVLAAVTSTLVIANLDRLLGP